VSNFTINLDDTGTRDQCRETTAGVDVINVTVIRNGKKANIRVSAHYQDSDKGLELRMHMARRNTDVRKSIYVTPWIQETPK